MKIAGLGVSDYDPWGARKEADRQWPLWPWCRASISPWASAIVGIVGCCHLEWGRIGRFGCQCYGGILITGGVETGSSGSWGMCGDD